MRKLWCKLFGHRRTSCEVNGSKQYWTCRRCGDVKEVANSGCVQRVREGTL